MPHVAGAGEMVVLMAALLGGTFGFLWFNAAPAMVFMGDVGSLRTRRGARGYAALVSRTELVLVVVGGVFVAEAMSVILQVGSFKLRASACSAARRCTITSSSVACRRPVWWPARGSSRRCWPCAACCSSR